MRHLLTSLLPITRQSKSTTMKKNLHCLLICFLTAISVTAQQGVAINTDGSAPHSDAILDVKSTTKGLLFPRMTYAQRIAISTPPGGLI